MQARFSSVASSALTARARCARRFRALHRQHHRLFLPVQQLNIITGSDERRDPVTVAVCIRSVSDDQEPLLIEAVHVRIVHDAALVVAQQRVVAAALGDLRDVVRDRAPDLSLPRPPPRTTAPCATRRTSPRACARRGVPQRCPCTAPASPTRRTAQSARPAARAGRTAASCERSSGRPPSAGAL